MLIFRKARVSLGWLSRWRPLCAAVCSRRGSGEPLPFYSSPTELSQLPEQFHFCGWLDFPGPLVNNSIVHLYTIKFTVFIVESPAVSCTDQNPVRREVKRGNLTLCWPYIYTINITLCSIQHTIYSVQYIVYTIQYAVYSVKYTVKSIQCTLYSILYTVHSEQCKIYRTPYTVHHNIQCTIWEGFQKK